MMRMRMYEIHLRYISSFSPVLVSDESVTLTDSTVSNPRVCHWKRRTGSDQTARK